jgi:hypothetical protein
MGSGESFAMTARCGLALLHGAALPWRALAQTSGACLSVRRAIACWHLRNMVCEGVQCSL